ncbi:unnamed protein product [Vicia faba]|uniref:Uncharacterized protein n=1 Tax=Vicia faba TaxID=3906 RepID=A0AAV1ALA8_VICFA|nr:unnamed protein product [Vicia faba]
MKPPKNFGSEEEFESSESGWTMYIGSHIEDDDGDIDNMDEEGTTHQGYPEDDESDDSMVSDASSGPSHQHGNDIGKGGGVKYGLQGFKQVVVVKETQYDDNDDDESNYCLEKKAIRTVEKKMEEKKLDGKGKSSVQGGGKVRKRK